MEKNLYEILNVSKNASTEEITARTRVLINKYKSEIKNENDRIIVQKKIDVIKNAYGILSDNKKRTEYDKFLKTKEEDKKIIEENIKNINTTSSDETLNSSEPNEIELPGIEEAIAQEKNDKEEVKKEKRKIEMSVNLIVILVLIPIVMSLVFMVMIINLKNKDNTLVINDANNILENKTTNNSLENSENIVLNEMYLNEGYIIPSENSYNQEDGDGIVFTRNEFGEKVILKKGEYTTFRDVNGRRAFVSEDGTIYYIDVNNNLKYYRDEDGNYYFEENHYKYRELSQPYEDSKYLIYRDYYGRIFYRDKNNEKIFIEEYEY